MTPKIMIILGSGSDIAIAEKSMDILDKLEIPYSLKIASAHRTPYLVREIVSQGTDAGIEVLIPREEEIELANNIIYKELCLGKIKDASRGIYQRIIDGLDMGNMGLGGFQFVEPN